MNEVTQLLMAFSNGNQEALDRVMPLVYDELRRLAHRHLGRERSDHTLNTTGLVHEAYMKMAGYRAGQDKWQDRSYFFAVASRAMRRILVDYARGRLREKRGGGLQRIDLDEVLLFSEEQSAGLLALDEALERLDVFDERQSRIVEYRFFGGLKTEEIAQVLDISASTVKRDWRVARAWLYREMKQVG